MNFNSVQPGILEENAPLARYLSFTLHSKANLRGVLKELIEHVDINNTVIGIGSSLVNAMGRVVDGLSLMPAQCGAGIEKPLHTGSAMVLVKG